MSDSGTVAPRSVRPLVSGQIVSSVGTGMTQVAIPLLAFQLTHSATILGITAAAGFLPYPTMGLFIGALADRTNRRVGMILADSGRAGLLIGAAALGLSGATSVWILWVLAFLNGAMSIYFDSCLFAVIPAIVAKDQLVRVNGRLQASLTAGRLAGRGLAGVGLLVASMWALLAIDGLSFVVSAAFILGMTRVPTADSPTPVGAGTAVRKVLADVRDGLRYVFADPLLRRLSMSIAASNIIGATATAELVLFAAERFDASGPQQAWLAASGALGTVLLSMAASPLRRYASVGTIGLAAVAVQGLALVAFAANRHYWFALPLWALHSGSGLMIAVYTGSLRQAIVPAQMLGRVASISQVLAWSGIPVGSLLGGLLISATHQTTVVYGVIGVGLLLVGVSLTVPALRKVDLPVSPGPRAPSQRSRTADSEARS